MALLWVGCVVGLYGLVTRGVGDDVPRLAAAAAWVLVVLLVLALPLAAYVVLTFRLVLDRDRIERHPTGASVAVGELREVRALPASTINRANRGARVQMIGPDGGMVAQIEESAAEWPRGLDMVRAWVSHRPELVKDDYTRERLLDRER